MPVPIDFSGWRLGPAGGTPCALVCGDTGGPQGCNAEATSQVYGVQTTINLSNILGLYDDMMAQPIRQSFESGDYSPPAAFITEGVDAGLVIILFPNSVVSCFTVATYAACCCTSDASKCGVPSDPSYDVVWP